MDSSLRWQRNQVTDWLLTYHRRVEMENLNDHKVEIMPGAFYGKRGGKLCIVNNCPKFGELT